jgi:lysozyme
MRYSSDGMHLTEGFEGCRYEAYRDVVGVLTIGYGHTLGVYEGQVITQDQAEAFLREDIQRSEDDINRLVKVPLTQGQFDALVDFDFNLGGDALTNSTLLRKLNKGDFEGAAKEFERWDMAGGKHLAGLFRRRKAEEDLFKSM